MAGARVDMSVTLADVELPNPLMTASGCAANGKELHRFFDVSTLGAFVTKSVMAAPRSGRGTPRMAETPSGMLNSIGLQGPGIHAFVENDLAWLKSVGARVLVSIAGGSSGEFADVAAVLRQSPAFDCVVGVEVNISCPNVANRGLVFAIDPLASAKVVALVREQLPRDIPVFAKLSPDVTDIASIASACVKAGASGLTMINTLLGMVIDTDRMRPQLGGLTGGLSGPGIRPIAVRAIWQVRAAMAEGRFRTVPIIGVGGVRTGRDALELVAAGASAIQVGTATFNDPTRTGARPPRAGGPVGGEGFRHFHAGGRCRPPTSGGLPVTTPFGARLRAAMDAYGPFCAGLDPHRGLVEQWGLEYSLAGLERFAMTCVEAYAGTVAVGEAAVGVLRGVRVRRDPVLERVLGDLRDAGTLTLLDVKRGDIGSTMQAYAEAYLGKDSRLRADAVTVSPFLGYGSLRPTLDLAEETGRGVFVLALTSNPEGFEVQHAVREDRSVAASVVAGAAADNAGAAARGELGSVGLVIGATVGDAVHDLGIDLVAANTPILAPGFGAQGGTVEALRRTFAGALPQVLASSSREVLGAGPDVAALRAAAAGTAARLQDALRS